METSSVDIKSAALNQLKSLLIKEVPQLSEIRFIPIHITENSFIDHFLHSFKRYLQCQWHIQFSVYSLDQYVSNFQNLTERGSHAKDSYRHLLGLIEFSKHQSLNQEIKLFLSFLEKDRNCKSAVKLFLKVRSTFLKNSSEKLLRKINLSHQDLITIILTMNFTSKEEKEILRKKVNQFFIHNSKKYMIGFRVNGVVATELFQSSLMLSRKDQDQTQLQEFQTKSTNFSSNKKSTKKQAMIGKENKDWMKRNNGNLTQFESSKIAYSTLQEPKQWLDTEEISFCRNITSLEVGQFLSKGHPVQQRVSLRQNQSLQFEEQKTTENKDSFEFQLCMERLNILREKDQEMDCRFKKIAKTCSFQSNNGDENK